MTAESQAERQLSSIIDSSDDAIFIENPEGVITSWNHGAEVIFGHKARSIIGKSGSVLSAAPFQGENKELIDHIMHGGSVFHHLTRRQCMDGKEIAISLTATPIREDGEITGGLMVARDITQQLKNERELEQSRRLDSVGQLARGVAHDFNHTLGLIKNYLRFVERDIEEENPRLEEDIATIQEAIGRGERLARQLMEFSQANDSNQGQHVNLNHIIDGLQPIITFPGVELLTNIDEDLPPVQLDPSQMQQILINLALNARDAMPNGGRLELHTYEKDGHACLDVSDTGHGMSSTIQERVLTPFFTTKARGEGTGLGLSTVYGIVTSSGGRLDIQSKVGKGTTIKLSLPVDKDEEHRSAPIPGEAPPT